MLKDYISMYPRESKYLNPLDFNRDTIIPLVSEVFVERKDAEEFANAFSKRYKVQTIMPPKGEDSGYIIFADVPLYLICSNYDTKSMLFVFASWA